VHKGAIFVHIMLRIHRKGKRTVDYRNDMFLLLVSLLIS